ncbi:AMOP domain protein [Ancylostoma caninum]|uniref:AMOP domain protein n=1 Tax=Ancylostoma caninum TaxID=29170 RepID=A0A368FIQ4_ANCCA|nr:AMOP domain protein [Ancylostoma caninum]
MDKQIDLDFFLPYYGFRFNYTFIFQEGFVAFSHPWYVQPPYSFPNPHWPSKPDPSLIAVFMAEQQMQHVGDQRISNVWFRIIERPTNLIGYNNLQLDVDEKSTEPSLRQPLGVYSYEDARFYRTYRGRQLKTQQGRLEDPEMLDRITRDIRDSMVGARGWKADYALIVTWERMSYGGAPKVTDMSKYEQAKRWQNTYQMVLATDEIRTYCMLNYANINWTSSSQSGALTRGRGGKQSALVGFNGGNGTGFYQLPFSSEGNSYKLVQFGSTQVAGRWLARIDEQIQYGGCTNDSRGLIELSQQYGNMLGGFALNVTGPCLRPNDVIKMQFDEITVDCERMDMVMARCVIPTNSVFKIGHVDVKLSVDAGKNYPWWTKFYIIQPGLARRRVNLINDPREPMNNWNFYDPQRLSSGLMLQENAYKYQNLTLSWEWENITANTNTAVDITLWGYWEDTEGHSFKQIGYIAKRHPNNGILSFTPRNLEVDLEGDLDAWRFYQGGVIQVRAADTWLEDKGDRMHWSMPIPFGWFFYKKWEYEYGREWALQLCQQWFDYDGRRENFVMELEPKIPCPCTLDQALLDIGRFTALPDCDMFGDHRCHYTQGAQHCVLSAASVWTGAGQTCCYDWDGWLMFSDDFEYNDQYLRFYSAGVPYRAHPFGAFPYKRPPYVPTMSNFFNDLLPYDICCKWAGHCEFYFWRRQTSTCQEYKPPTIGFVYGENHFVTYDGTRYSFHGKGFYVLSMMKSPRHDFMLQARFEQPPETLWEERVRSTVMTGLAVRDNQSSVVQVFARKDHRRWRYRTDVYVDGERIFFDMPWKKIQTFSGVTIRSPPRNMNQSEIEVMFASGASLRIEESRGLLNVVVALPASFNETDWRSWNEPEEPFFWETTTQAPLLSRYDKCSTQYRTVGLLGTFNGDPYDDLTTPDCMEIRTSYPQTEADARNVYYEFGEKWRLDRNLHIASLFQPEHKPIYDPLSFADDRYSPLFDPWLHSNYSSWSGLIFSREEVKVLCQGVPACEYDFMSSGRREDALDTLEYERKFELKKQKGEIRVQSCGPLVKSKGVLKYPSGNNYLHGITVTFSCKPEYFLHGEQQRTCVNGTWSPGWWPWCRERTEETALKWMTGILSSVAIILAIVVVFIWCAMEGRRRQRDFIRGRKMHSSL